MIETKQRRATATAEPSGTAGTKRDVLIAVARARFGQAGYHATSTNDLVALASATRGALYHHFVDKKHLFAEVARQVAQELSQTASEAVETMAGTTWERMLAALPTYLLFVAANPEAQRILLIDGPSVLGWQDWRDLQSAIILPRTVEGLDMLMDEGVIRRAPAEPLAHLILAALNDAALTVAHAQDPESARTEMSDALLQLIAGLKSPSMTKNSVG